MSEDEPFRYYDDDGNLHPDYVSCPTCNGQGYRDEYSGDPEHGGETCYHCYGHGIVHRTEEENRPIDDIMRDMANDPTKENAQAVRDYFTPKPEMEYDDDFQQKLTGSPMDLAFRLLKAVMPGTAGFPEDEHNTDNIIAIQEQAYRLAELNTPWDKERWPNYEDWQEAIEMDGEGILAQMMHEPEYAHLRELYSQHSQPPENYGELQLPFKERDDIHNFYRNQGIPLPGEPIHIPGIGELPPVPSKVTMHEVDDHPQWPTGTLYDDKSGFTTGEPMDLAWRLLKMSESEMMNYYHPETQVERYRERARRRGTRLRPGLANKIRQHAQLRTRRKELAGIPSHLLYAHHDHPELIEARVQVSRAVGEPGDTEEVIQGKIRAANERGDLSLGREKLIPYEAHEKNRIADLRGRPIEWGIEMTPTAIYNNQRMFSQMIPEGFLMEDPEPDNIEPSGIPGMVFINGAGPVPDPRAVQTGEPMDLSWRLLKFRLPMKTNHRSVLPKPNMSRQTTLPEFAPNMSSPHGDVKWFHGTSGDRVGSIQTEGLKPNQGKVWVTGNRDVAENYAGGRSANRYIEEVMQPGGDLASPTQNPVTFGIREGAGSPKRHMGMESFDNTIKPEQLVRMPPTQKPANPAWHTGKSETGPSTGAQGQ